MGCGASTNKALLPPEKTLKQDLNDEKSVKNDERIVDEFEEATVVPLPERNLCNEKFNCIGPSLVGEEVTPCFENGLLFRLVKGDAWILYNDTCNYEMHVCFVFSSGSKVQCLGTTRVTQLKETGDILAEVVVYPCETLMFVRGSITGFKSKIKAMPLSEEYLQLKAKEYSTQMKIELLKVSELSGGSGTDNEILAKCVSSGIPFVDINFLPTQESIANGLDRPVKTIPWGRPRMYLQKSFVRHVRLFRTRISPMRIAQGDLGDLWVMCAIAAISEDPKQVRNMFLHPTNPALAAKERAVGAYRVTLNKNGWWRSVIVDDYLPVIGDRPKYAKSIDDTCEMWVSILEKAYAKVHGSYANILAGDPLLALQDLTGCPTTRYDQCFASEADLGGTEFLQRLERYHRHGFQIILSTPVMQEQSKEVEKKYEEVGLIMGHAYVARAVRYFVEENIGLLQIRNPWVRGVDWKGDWSDSDSKWKENPNIADACGHGQPVEGAFWMSWEDVRSYFNGCGVAFTHPKSSDYRIRGVFSRGIPSVCIQMKVKKPTYVVCTLSQEDRRGTPRVQEDYPPIMLTLSGGRGSLTTMQALQNTNLDADHTTNQFTFMQSRDVGMLCTLTPENSPYILIPRIISEEESVPYVVGLFLENSGSDVMAAFCTLPPDCKAFENFPTFSGEGSSLKAEFQVRHPNGRFPLEYVKQSLTED